MAVKRMDEGRGVCRYVLKCADTLQCRHAISLTQFPTSQECYEIMYIKTVRTAKVLWLYLLFIAKLGEMLDQKSTLCPKVCPMSLSPNYTAGFIKEI